MNKVISVAAILALSAASNEFADLELANFHLDQARLPRPMPIFTPLVAHDDNDDEFLIRLNPELTRPVNRFPTNIMIADDNDDELVYASALRADDNDDEFMSRVNPPELINRPSPPKFFADDNDDEFYVEQADNELGFFKKIGDGLKKAGQFVVQHPQIITTAAKFLDDNDDEFVYASALRADDEFMIRLNPELTRPINRFPPSVMIADDNDDEFFADVQDDEFMSRINPPELINRPPPPRMRFADDNDDEFVYASVALRADDNDDEFMSRINPPELINRPHPPKMRFADDNDDEFFAQDAALIKKAQRNFRVSNEALNKARAEKKPEIQDNLATLSKLLKEGKTIQAVKRPQPRKIAEVQDNNLSIKDKLKGAANWIGDHPQVITEAAKTYKALKGKK